MANDHQPVWRANPDTTVTWTGPPEHLMLLAMLLAATDGHTDVQRTMPVTAPDDPLTRLETETVNNDIAATAATARTEKARAAQETLAVLIDAFDVGMEPPDLTRAEALALLATINTLATADVDGIGDAGDAEVLFGLRATNVDTDAPGDTRSLSVALAGAHVAELTNALFGHR